MKKALLEIHIYAMEILFYWGVSMFLNFVSFHLILSFIVALTGIL